MNTPRKLLVTGGAGFIGTNFVRYWREQHPHDHVTVLDALTYAGCKGNLEICQEPDNFEFIKGDICDAGVLDQVFQDQAIDTVVHFAAETHVDRSIRDPDLFLKTNVIGTQRLLEAARQHWSSEMGVIRRFHHVSTDEVYGTLEPGDPAFSESHPYAPNSPYAASKAAADHLVRAYNRTYDVPVTISNCSNNYGPYQYPEKLIPLCIVNALQGKPLPIYGDGRQRRDWLHVDDHCRAIDIVIRKGRIGEMYNIGGNWEIENIELVNMLCDALDQRVLADAQLLSRFPDSMPAAGKKSRELITYIADRPGHDRRYAIDSSKITSELDFTTQTQPQQGLAGTIAWYLEAGDWWKALYDAGLESWMALHYQK